MLMLQPAIFSWYSHLLKNKCFCSYGKVCANTASPMGIIYFKFQKVTKEAGKQQLLEITI